MCGAIAAAASVTAVASSTRVFTSVMLPEARPSSVSVRCLSPVGRACPVAAVVGLVAPMQIVGVVEELEIPRRLAHPCEQHRYVAELLRRMRLDVEHVVPERVPLLRRRHCGARRELEYRFEPLVVQGGEPCAHLCLVAAPMLHKRDARGKVLDREIPLPDLLGLALKPRAPAPLDIEGVHERAAKIARR